MYQVFVAIKLTEETYKSTQVIISTKQLDKGTKFIPKLIFLDHGGYKKI